MSPEQTEYWDGISGKYYAYWVQPIGTVFQQVPGNYIFAKETRPGIWEALYVGETENLSTCFDNHEKLPCIKRSNGTHIHVHTGGATQSKRMEEADDIRKKHDPLCNRE